MLRNAVVLLGLAVMLSLLFPIRVLLLQGGVDPLALQLHGIDLAALCAIAAVLPAMALSRHGQLPKRVPRWNLWLALLALCSLLFLLLHVSWSVDLATSYLADALSPGGAVPLRVAPDTLVRGAEFVVRLGVLVAMVGVLVTLQAVPVDEPPTQKRRRRRSQQ
jgi:hypothetical protein